MAAFERSTATSAPAASGALVLVPRGAAEPMQRAIDGWYRDQPEAFARPAEMSTADDPAAAADRAIALNHMLAYGRLAAERDFAMLRDRAASDGSPVLVPLLRQVEARNAELLSRVPAELHPALSAGLGATTDGLLRKAATIDEATAGRRQAEALEQSVALGAALLRQDPGQYETLVADAGAMVEGLGLEDGPRQALGRGIRRQLAEATLLAQADPVAGDPDAAAADLARGRLRDAFDADGIKAWRELVAANQARAAAEAARREQDAGIVAEIKMLNRLAAAGRAEAPMPAPAEVETVFPGEGEQHLAAAARNRTGALYAAEIATQPFDKDSAWIEAATDDEDRAIRTETVQQKRREFAQSGGGSLLAQYPALGAAVAAGVEDSTKLDLAINLYQRQLQKLGVPPGQRPLLPWDLVSPRVEELRTKYVGMASEMGKHGEGLSGPMLDHYLTGGGADYEIPGDAFRAAPQVQAAVEKIQTHFADWLEDPNVATAESERIKDKILALASTSAGSSFEAASRWQGLIFSGLSHLSDLPNAVRTAEVLLTAAREPPGRTDAQDEIDLFFSIGASVLEGSADFRFERDQTGLKFVGDVTLGFDERYDFEENIFGPLSLFIPPRWDADPDELHFLERFGGARTFRSYVAPWHMTVIGHLSVEGDKIDLDSIHWTAGAPRDFATQPRAAPVRP